ncbi:MAG: alpha/beta fold hydrolase, partial [Anaerolineae bacterium]|nr:alpha/beta fold hydrolase [Anaerolineae bacterium]
MDDHYYISGAEPFFYPGGRVGCLVTHGLASSPGEVRWLGQHLAQQGFTVYGPRLAGHGTDYHDLAHIHWHDWYGTVLDGYQLLRAQCDHVFLIGHSTGGTLSMLAGVHLPVAGVATLAGPVYFGGWQPVVGKWLRYVHPYLHLPDDGPLPERVRAEQRRRGEPERGRFRYDRWATNGPVQLYELAKVTRPQLPLLKAPLLAIYSQADTVID